MLTAVNELTGSWTGRATKKVVVVNGSPEILELLESVLDAGHYDTVFVSDIEHAYSQVKSSSPNLIILCLAIDDPVGFQVLSMLKLDKDTEDIPVLTYTNEFERDDAPPEEDDDSAEFELPTPPRELPLN
jgi:PleD family two-component response regulator